MQTAVRLVLVVAVLALFATRAFAAELVMFDRTGCPWCAKWHAEIGIDRYNATPQGRQAPLRVINVADPLPSDLTAVGQIVGTPTFVLMDRGAVVDRMEGYPGKQVFYGRLMLMLDKLTGADRQYRTIIVQ